MFRFGVIAIAAVLTSGVFASVASAQSAGERNRAAAAAKFRAKMPACKAQAAKQNLHFSQRRAFIRQCLRKD